jgi:hypothetical protein
VVPLTGMSPPFDTGFPTADAQDDFLRARRRQTLSKLARRLTREPGDVDVILPFDEVVRALGRIGERRLNLQAIELDSIVGTVDRTTGFDRQFRPTTSRIRVRWERIANAERRGMALPPISVYRIGEVHFVRDGHHRVSVARAHGRRTISASVTEVLTRVGAERTLTLADLPRKSHERLFRERVPLPAEAAARVRPTDGWDYGVLAEGVEAWGFRLMQDRAEHLDRAQTARRWYADEFVPVVQMLREAGLLGRGTEADAYLRASEQRYRLMRTHAWSQDAIEQIGAATRRERERRRT